MSKKRRPAPKFHAGDTVYSAVNTRSQPNDRFIPHGWRGRVADDGMVWNGWNWRVRVIWAPEHGHRDMGHGYYDEDALLAQDPGTSDAFRGLGGGLAGLGAAMRKIWGG